MELLSNKLTWPRFARDFGVFFLIYVSAIIFLPKSLFMEMANSMLAVIALVVVVVYSSGLLERVKAGQLGIAMIRAGIVGTWSMTFIASMFRLYALSSHSPRGGLFDFAYSLPIVILIVFAAAHIIAIGMVENRYVRRNVCLVLWSLIAGAGIVGVLRGLEHWRFL